MDPQMLPYCQMELQELIQQLHMAMSKAVDLQIQNQQCLPSLNQWKLITAQLQAEVATQEAALREQDNAQEPPLHLPLGDLVTGGQSQSVGMSPQSMQPQAPHIQFPRFSSTSANQPPFPFHVPNLPMPMEGGSSLSRMSDADLLAGMKDINCVSVVDLIFKFSGPGMPGNLLGHGMGNVELTREQHHQEDHYQDRHDYDYGGRGGELRDRYSEGQGGSRVDMGGQGIDWEVNLVDTLGRDEGWLSEATGANNSASSPQPHVPLDHEISNGVELEDGGEQPVRSDSDKCLNCFQKMTAKCLTKCDI